MLGMIKQVRNMELGAYGFSAEIEDLQKTRLCVKNERQRRAVYHASRCRALCFYVCFVGGQPPFKRSKRLRRLIVSRL